MDTRPPEKLVMALPNTKYKYSVLFLCQSVKCIIYVCFKIYFLIDHHCKIKTEIFDLLKKGRIG